jgi:hypothetical protein
MNSPTFHPEEANKIKRFIETYCLQPADSNFGRAGQPLILLDWQLTLINQFFGVGQYIDGKWKRKYRKGITFVPKKVIPLANQ